MIMKWPYFFLAPLPSQSSLVWGCCSLTTFIFNRTSQIRSDRHVPSWERLCSSFLVKQIRIVIIYLWTPFTVIVYLEPLRTIPGGKQGLIHKVTPRATVIPGVIQQGCGGRADIAISLPESSWFPNKPSSALWPLFSCWRGSPDSVIVSTPFALMTWTAWAALLLPQLCLCLPKTGHYRECWTYNLFHSHFKAKKKVCVFWFKKLIYLSIFCSKYSAKFRGWKLNADEWLVA